MRKTASVALILFLVLLFYTQLPRTHPTLCLASVALSLVSFLTAVFYRKFSLVLLGVALCVMPILGAGHLNLFLSAWLLGAGLKRAQGENENMPRVVCPLLFLVLPFILASIFAFLLDADVLVLGSILSGGGAGAFLQYITSNNLSWHHSFLHAAGYVSMALLCIELYRNRKDSSRILLGLSIGALISVVFCFAQWMGFHEVFSFNRDAFWVFTKRYEGTFTDPNSMGLMCAFLFPILFISAMRLRNVLFLVAAFALLFVMPSSGSRSGFIALCLWAAVAGFRKTKNKLKTAGISIALFLVIVFVLGSPGVNSYLRSRVSEGSFSRLLETISWETAPQAVEGRFQFAKMAIEMWKQSPIIGVGLNRFYGMQAEIAEANNIPLGTWRDNANNYYLQVLSENGLLGLLLVCIGFLALYRNFSKSREADSIEYFYSTGLIVLAIILITGPHFFFDEFRYLAAFMLASSLSSNGPQKSLVSLKAQAVFLALASLIYLSIAVYNSPLRSMEGFWDREVSNEGVVYWSAKHARLRFCSEKEQEIALQLRTFNPALPVRLNYEVSGAESQLVFEDSQWKELRLNISKNTPVDFKVDKIWSPPGDARWLGVMFKEPPSLCELK